MKYIELKVGRGASEDTSTFLYVKTYLELLGFCVTRSDDVLDVFDRSKHVVEVEFCDEGIKIFVNGVNRGSKLRTYNKQCDSGILNSIGCELFNAEVIDNEGLMSFSVFAEAYEKFHVFKLLVSTYCLHCYSHAELREKYREVYNYLKAKLEAFGYKLGSCHYHELQIGIINLVISIDRYPRAANEGIPYTPDSCIRVCKKLECSDVDLLIGRVYLELKDCSPDCLEYFDRVIKADPKCHLGYFYKARYAALSYRGITVAINNFKKGLSLFPDSFREWYCLGNAYADNGNWDDAINAFKSVIKLCSNKGCYCTFCELIYLFKSLVTIGNIYWRHLHKEQKAINAFKKAEEVYGRGEQLCLLEVLYDDAFEQRRVIKSIEESMCIKKVYNSLSQLYSAIGKRTEAELYYDLWESNK